MKYLVFGSFNIDRVFSLPHLPEKGESVYCSNVELHVGGKGLNQAVALARAGADVRVAGAVGQDGGFLTDYLENIGIDTSLVKVTGGFTGQTVIEVDPDGQNQFILFAGANGELAPEDLDRALESFGRGDLILLQYETASVEYAVAAARKKGLTVAMNPSPYVDKLREFDYSGVDILILNESEGRSISGELRPEKITEALRKRMDGGTVILTLGKDGAVYDDGETYCFVPIFPAEAVDTTGAGDTFTGYCLEALLGGAEPEAALRRASAASALEVARMGAAEVIPGAEEVERFLLEQL